MEKHGQGMAPYPEGLSVMSYAELMADKVALEARLRALEAENERLRGENDALRAIAAKVMPCHYCGVDSIVKCPHGFPGCALADDMMEGDAALARELHRVRAGIEAAVKRLRAESEALKRVDPGSFDPCCFPDALADDLARLVGAK